MTLTNFPNGISSFGIPVMGGGGIPAVSGTVYFVDYGAGSDGNTGKSPDRAFKTIDKAVNSVTTNKDDVICLIGNSTHVLSEMLTVSKSRVHFIGLDGTPGRMYGQNAKVSLTATSGATNIATILNTGVRNSFHNIKFINESTVAEGIYCVAEGGEYALYSNCEFYKSTDLDVTGAAELLLNGDSPQFVNCTFGSLANAISGAVIRPCVELTKGLAGTGLVTRDALFDGCLFWRQITNTANAYIHATNANDVERQMLLRNCGFINNIAGGAAAAVCIDLDATLTTGYIILDPGCYTNGNTKIATATGVIVTGAAPNSGTGIGVNAA